VVERFGTKGEKVLGLLHLWDCKLLNRRLSCPRLSHLPVQLLRSNILPRRSRLLRNSHLPRVDRILLSNWLPCVNRLSCLFCQLLLALFQLLLQLLHFTLSLFHFILSKVDGFVVDSSVSSLFFFHRPQLLFQSPQFLLKLFRAWFKFSSCLLEQLLELSLHKLLLLQLSF